MLKKKMVFLLKVFKDYSKNVPIMEINLANAKNVNVLEEIEILLV